MIYFYQAVEKLFDMFKTELVCLTSEQAC